MIDGVIDGEDELDVYMEKARCNTELYSNLRAPLNNVNRPTFGVTSPISSPFKIMLKVLFCSSLELLHHDEHEEC